MMTRWKRRQVEQGTFGPIITFDSEAETGPGYVIGQLLTGLTVKVVTHKGEETTGLVSRMKGDREHILVLTDWETDREVIAEFDLYEDVKEVRYL
jgi:hypothetical protein